MMILLFVLLWQVISRYVLKNPSTVTEELSRLLLVVMASTWAVLSFIERKHLALDLLVQKATPERKIHFHEISAIATIIFGLILTVGGVLLIKEKWSLAQTSSMLGFRLVYFYFLIPFCGAIIILSPFYWKFNSRGEN